MNRQEKIKKLQAISEGRETISALIPIKVFMLNLGVIEFWDMQGDGRKMITQTLYDFCKKFRKDKDWLLIIYYTGFNLPERFGHSDPSGETLKQIIAIRPDLDCQDWQESIATMADLTKSDYYKTINERM